MLLAAWHSKEKKTRNKVQENETNKKALSLHAMAPGLGILRQRGETVEGIVHLVRSLDNSWYPFFPGPPPATNVERRDGRFSARYKRCCVQRCSSWSSQHSAQQFQLLFFEQR